MDVPRAYSNDRGDVIEREHQKLLLGLRGRHAAAF